MLTRRESDTYLATVSRHRWSRQIMTKIDKNRQCCTYRQNESAPVKMYDRKKS